MTRKGLLISLLEKQPVSVVFLYTHAIIACVNVLTALSGFWPHRPRLPSCTRERAGNG